MYSVSTSSTFTKIEKRKTMLCNRGRFILVVMSITLYYLWDGNTFQIGYPSNVAFFRSYNKIIIIIIIGPFLYSIRPFHLLSSLSLFFCCRLVQLYSVRRNHCVEHVYWIAFFIFYLIFVCDCDFFSSSNGWVINMTVCRQNLLKSKPKWK